MESFRSIMKKQICGSVFEKNYLRFFFNQPPYSGYNPNNIDFHILYFLHLNNVKDTPSLPNKFKILDTFLNNPFLSEGQKSTFLDKFCEFQKIYFGFSKLLRMYRYKHADIANTEDLSMVPIVPSKSNITIYQNKSLFVFKISELINILMMSLTNHCEFFMSPLNVKNPYNNTEFSLSILYFIYFSIKNSTFVMPTFIHMFFMNDFNIVTFKTENDVILREYAIKQYIYKSRDDELYPNILLMLAQNLYTFRLKIDPTFPKDKMVQLMRPLLYIQYRYLYASISNDEQDLLYYKLFTKLRKLYDSNPMFGRKYVVINNQKIETVTYNDKCEF
jgi:hypothetical protein